MRRFRPLLHSFSCGDFSCDGAISCCVPRFSVTDCVSFPTGGELQYTARLDNLVFESPHVRNTFEARAAAAVLALATDREELLDDAGPPSLDTVKSTSGVLVH